MRLQACTSEFLLLNMGIKRVKRKSSGPSQDWFSVDGSNNAPTDVTMQIDFGIQICRIPTGYLKC